MFGWTPHLSWLIAGTAGGGLVLGGALAIAWGVLAPFAAVRTGSAVGGMSLMGLAILMPSLRAWIPERAHQVSSSGMLAKSISMSAFRWGFTLGLGVRTYVVTPAFYALLAASFVQSTVWAAVLLGSVYGIARGVAIAAFAWARTRRGSDDGDPGAGLEKKLRIPLEAALLVAIAASLATALP